MNMYPLINCHVCVSPQVLRLNEVNTIIFSSGLIQLDLILTLRKISVAEPARGLVYLSLQYFNGVSSKVICIQRGHQAEET